MFRVFQEERLITICMFTFLGGSILLRVFLGLLYRNMIKEADNMATTRNRLLKQCKTKFASCYQLGNGVANIPVFVDKFLNRMALGRLSFETIYHMSGQMMLLSVVCSGIGVCKSIIGGRTVGEVLPFYIVSFFGLYVYFSVSTVVNVRGKRRALKINLVDYLENHLSPRIEVTRQDMEMLYGEAAYTEKGLSRGQGSRNGKGKGRKRGRGIQAMPEKRRTVELMPIESRKAVGGEPFQEPFSVGQASQGQQAAWAETARQERPQAMGREEEMVQYPGQVAESGAEQQSKQMWDAEPEQQRRQMPGAERQARETLAEEKEQIMTRMSGEKNANQMQQSEQAGRMLWAEQTQKMPETQWREQREPFGESLQAKTESPEDSAAVTEEELEALLKEFLTT